MALVLACSCGAATAVLHGGASSVWGIFACHCSQCSPADRRVGYANGVPWVAVPRVTWTNVVSERSSTFAVRGYCASCERALYIHYDCELHTAWIHADLFTAPDLLRDVKVSHIHSSAVQDGTTPLCGQKSWYRGFEPWEPDPCRPIGSSPPRVCFQCFQLACQGCRPHDHPRKFDTLDVPLTTSTSQHR